MTESSGATLPAPPHSPDESTAEHAASADEPGDAAAPSGLDEDHRPAAAPSASTAGDAPEAAAAELSRVAETQARILEELGQLRETFSLKIRFDEAKERAIDALNDEVQRHRQGLHFSILRPLFLDLITLYDDLLQCAGAAPDGASAARTLQSLADSVEEILARNGVNALSVEGQAFDGKRQRAVRTVPTTDAAEAGRVAQRIRRGFEHDERILRPEHVSTYRFEAQGAVPGPSVVPDPEPTPQASAS